MFQYTPPPSGVVKAVFARVRERGTRRKSSYGSSDQRGPIEPTISDVIAAEKELPKLNEAKIDDLKDLMIKKLRLCCVIFYFNPLNDGISSDLSNDQDQEQEWGKEAKKSLLLELTQLVMDSKRQWFSEDVLIEVLHMTATNLFRALPPTEENWDPEEDVAIKDPAWSHLQMVYEFLFYFTVSSQSKPELMHNHVSESYLQNLIKLFKSNDCTERDYLKNILHRIYQRFFGFRPFIRNCIGKTLWRATYEMVPGLRTSVPAEVFEENTDDWIGELLEIWGTIVSGFSVPLLEEHRDFLRKILIPLHKKRSLKHYHHHLAYCILHYIDKEPSLCTEIIEGLIKFWPQQSSDKERLFIQELEEILDISSRVYLVPVLPGLFKQIGRSIKSQHFQVSERALFLWNKDVVATLTADFRDSILPILYPAITNKHWHPPVNDLCANIVKMFKEMDHHLWERTEKAYENNHTMKIKKREERLRKWEIIRTIDAVI